MSPGTLEFEASIVSRCARIETNPWFTSSPYEPALPPVRSLEEIDLLDPDLYHKGDPHAAWRLLRREAPVFWHDRGSPGTEGKGFWVLTRYDDAVIPYRNTKVFSSERSPFLDLDAHIMPREILASIDGEKHTLNRSIVAPSFTPGALRRFAEAIRAITHSLLDRAAEKEKCDFLADIAARLPVMATCHLLGIDFDEAKSLSALLSVAEPNTPDALETFNDATLHFFQRVAEERRRTGARDSILGIVANAESGGGALPQDQVSHILWNLFFGGIDSTAHAATGGLLALFHHPEQLDLLRRHPTLARDGIDEIIRWTSISHANKRLVKEDVQIGGKRINKGDYVTMWSSSGNRDETVFEDPYCFDLRRKMTRPIIAFGGGGPHQCLGQFFARMELSILFEELFRRFPDLEQVGSAERARHFTVQTAAFKSLPISLGKSASGGA